MDGSMGSGRSRWGSGSLEKPGFADVSADIDESSAGGGTYTAPSAGGRLARLAGTALPPSDRVLPADRDEIHVILQLRVI